MPLPAFPDYHGETPMPFAVHSRLPKNKLQLRVSSKLWIQHWTVHA
jgi:hypothetical protein